MGSRGASTTMAVIKFLLALGLVCLSLTEAGFVGTGSARARKSSRGRLQGSGTRTGTRLRRDFVAAGTGNAKARAGKQLDAVQGGIDFSTAVFDEDTGKRCVIKEEEIESIEKEPILECTHKNVEKCHYTYVTQFTPSQEEVCEENYEKQCSITFKQQAFNETVRKCYKPVEKVCNGEGEEECRTVYESSCTTKYIEKQPGKFVGDTACEKLPIEICGAGCTYEEGPEECHDKVVASLVDVPEEVCDLNPQKTCRLQTKLVPRLKPEHECTTFPQEVCNLKFTQPRRVKKPLITKWCLDDSPVVPGELYDESNARSGRLLPVKANENKELDKISTKQITLNSENFQTQGFEQFVDFSRF